MAAGHRVFAAFWDSATKHEGPKQRQARRAAVSGSRGHVLELGVGVGANWRYLPADVTYAGVEPDEHMLARARANAVRLRRTVELHQARAESLPFSACSFDTVFATLTLCSIDDPSKALAEVRRVLKPGGELRFWEHVRPRSGLWGRAMDLVSPAWGVLGGGCRPNRNTREAISDARFVFQELEATRLGVLPAIRGVAVLPGAQMDRGADTVAAEVS